MTSCFHSILASNDSCIPRYSQFNAAIASLISSQSQTSVCASVQTHVEWRQLQPNQQQSYITAIMCMHKVPSVLAGIGSPSLWDDFVHVHQLANALAHNTAAFLPWHRLFLSTFDVNIRSRCNYTEAMPYWDWSIDSQAPEASPVWSPNAFGGTGSGPNHCLSDGIKAVTQVPSPISQSHSHNRSHALLATIRARLLHLFLEQWELHSRPFCLNSSILR